MSKTRRRRFRNRGRRDERDLAIAIENGLKGKRLTAREQALIARRFPGPGIVMFVGRGFVSHSVGFDMNLVTLRRDRHRQNPVAGVVEERLATPGSERG